MYFIKFFLSNLGMVISISHKANLIKQSQINLIWSYIFCYFAIHWRWDEKFFPLSEISVLAFWLVIAFYCVSQEETYFQYVCEVSTILVAKMQDFKLLVSINTSENLEWSKYFIKKFEKFVEKISMQKKLPAIRFE